MDETVYARAQRESGIKAGDFVLVERVAKEGEGDWPTTWTPSMNSSVGKMYEVSYVTKEGVMLEWFLFPYFVLRKTSEYAYRQSRSGLKVGQKVKVTRKAADYEGGWSTVWVPKMDKYVGEILTIDGISEDGIRCEGWYFPYFILEPQLERPDPIYETLRKITLKEVMKEGACREEILRVLDYFFLERSYEFDEAVRPEDMEKIYSEPVWLAWLIDKEFLAEKNPPIKVQSGDLFCSDDLHTAYIVTYVFAGGGEVTIMEIHTGEFGVVSVKDFLKRVPRSALLGLTHRPRGTWTWERGVASPTFKN